MTPGQAAYEKWTDLVLSWNELSWNELSQSGKDGWEQVAKSAIEANTCGSSGLPCVKFTLN